MELIQEIGSYAGFAAVVGLAVLSALYFSQARDVKRLRDWAGRAPERDAEARARVAAADNLRATPAAQKQAQPAAAVAAQPAAQTAAQSGAQAAAAPAAQSQPAVVANSGGSPAVVEAPAVGGAAAGATTVGESGSGTVPVVPASRAPAVAAASKPSTSTARPSAQTSILAAQERPRERWYRRIAPRYIALIVAGVLVVGGGIAVGTIELLSDDGAPGTTSASGGASSDEPETAPGARLRPGDVSVAVLNATGVPGLASTFGDRAQAKGFMKDNVGNAPGGQRAESVVLYAPGREREARLVSRRFGVSNIEPVDPDSQGLAPEADVVLTLGADNTQ